MGELDQHPIKPADLDDASYVAVAGRVMDGIYGKIQQAMTEKFHDSARPQMMPRSSGPQNPLDIVAYCYLFKQLDFTVPFENLETPLNIAGTAVSSFGMGLNKPQHEAMAADVLISDYLSPDDFIIELKTKSEKDHLIFAKVKPAQTLGKTIEMVEHRRSAGKPIAARPYDELAIPKFNFDLTRNYDELLNKKLISPTTGAIANQRILSADQNIRFLMDEIGVQIRSESHISIGCSVPLMTIPEHTMIFDKPFLLELRREGGEHPYFAMWVDGTELLVRDSPSHS